jgi:hypothetical protein
MLPVAAAAAVARGSSSCSNKGFEGVDPASVALAACFYKQLANGSYAYWIKKPGELWFQPRWFGCWRIPVQMFFVLCIFAADVE